MEKHWTPLVFWLFFYWLAMIWALSWLVFQIPRSLANEGRVSRSARTAKSATFWSIAATILVLALIGGLTSD